MKKLLLISSIAVLTSCSNSQLSCSSDEAKKLTKEIFIENTNLNHYSFSNHNVDLERLEKFYDEDVLIENIRTSSIDEKIKKCTCEATVMFDIDYDLLERLKTGKTREYDIEYSVQETDNGEIYVETYFPEGMNKSIAFYLGLYKEKRWQNESTQTFESRDGYVTYKLKFLSADKIEVYFNQGTHEETFEVDFIDGKMINPNFADNPKSPQFKLEIETLRVKDKRNGGYSTYYRK